jgi:hypothetical protein
MTTVHVDRRLLSIGDPGEALAHLEDGGFDVAIVDDLPADLPPAGDWLLTPDRSSCGAARRRRIRTILVGPHLETHHPTERCDLEARDLPAAALAVLAAEAMTT